MADIDVLFDELAAAYVRGERPDLPAYLARAGDEADELARLVDAFLRTVPPPEPSEDDVAVMRARLGGEPGLLALRKRRGRKVDDVVDELASRLDVDDRPRLRRYYQRLEGGVLDPPRIDERVWEALQTVFETSVRNLIRPLVTRQGGSAMAYYRRTVSPDGDGAGPAPAAVPSLVTRGDPAPAERDALDRLFLGDA
jgi:AcrR family transcriptional regulator